MVMGAGDSDGKMLEIVRLPKGTQFNFGDSVYSLSKDLDLRYVDWRGAYAGVYMENPFLRDFVNCGPNLDFKNPQDEISCDACDIICGMAQAYHSLLQQPAEKRNEPLARQLEKFFEVSKAA